MQFFLYEDVLVILYKKYLLLFSKYLLTGFYVLSLYQPIFRFTSTYS